MNKVMEARALGKKFRAYRKERSIVLNSAQLVKHFVSTRKILRQPYFWAFRNVNLEVRENETVGLIGPNGAGKSSLLKMASGIYKPDEGEIYIYKRVSPLLELGAGFHPDLTGRENIYLNGAILGLTRREIKQRFDDMVAYAELENFVDTPLRFYSSGMQVRLGFAVAVHTNPEFLLVDEVLAVGDFAFQQKCLNTILQFKKEGRSILFVSHQHNQVLNVCDRCAVLVDGQIIFDGEPQAAISHYTNFIKEKVPVPEEQRKTEWEEGLLEIMEVTLQDNQGYSSTIFYNGKDMTVKIRYRCRGVVEDSKVIMEIYNVNGHHVAAFDSSTDNFPRRPLAGDNYLHLHLRQLPLRRGQYLINVSFWDKNQQKRYHAREGIFFEVVPLRPQIADTLYISYAWEQPAGESLAEGASRGEPGQRGTK